MQVREQTKLADNINYQIKGVTRVNGNNYETICDCFESDKIPKATDLNSKCQITQLRVTHEQDGVGAGEMQIRNLIGEIRKL